MVKNPITEETENERAIRDEMENTMNPDHARGSMCYLPS